MVEQEWSAAFAALTRDCTEITRFTAGPVWCYGRHAFPVVLGVDGGVAVPVVGAAQVASRGRVVALGHSGLLSKQTSPGTHRFVCNALKWVAKQGASARPIVLIMSSNLGPTLTATGEFRVLEADTRADTLPLASVDAVLLGEGALSEMHLEQIRAWVARRGGGVVCALCPWGWLQLSKAKNLAECGTQQLLWDCGMAFGGTSYVEPPVAGPFRVGGPRPPAETHSLLALDRLHAAPALAAAQGTLLALPPDENDFALRMAELWRARQQHGARPGLAVVEAFLQSVDVQRLVRAPLAARDIPADETVATAPPWQADHTAICVVRGVTQLFTENMTFGPVYPCTESAFPLILGRLNDAQDVPIACGARVGRGRVLAFGHSATLTTAFVARNAALMNNALHWLRPGVASPTVLVVNAKLAMGAPFRATRQTLPSLGGIDVVVVGEGELSPAHAQALLEFVEAGGGLACAVCPWGWRQLHNNAPLRDCPQQQLLWRCGLAFGPECVEETVRGGFSVTSCPPTVLHVWHALTVLGSPHASRAQCVTAQRVASAALSALPADGPLQKRMAALASAGGAAPVPTTEAPIRATAFLQRFTIATQLNQQQLVPHYQVRRHPAAAVFPGECMGVPAGARKYSVTLDGKWGTTRWNSTGLYATAGQTICVRVVGGSAAGLGLRIGCHSDSLLHLDSWSRIPVIDLEQDIFLDASGCFSACSAFGGLVYIVVPDTQRSPAAVLELSGGLVEAPFFMLGRDTNADWMRRRNADAPFGELVSRKVALSIPSQHLRTLDDPTSLMQFWDRVSDACADLAAQPRDRPYAWRYVADVQISAGYMHSGYPIMTHLDAAPRMVNLAALRSVGEWGLFHELGHNHQADAWTFDGTVEVTCNLFTLYTMHAVCGTPLHGGCDALQQGRMEELEREHVRGGRSFERWKEDPFLALIMYYQLLLGFGWPAFVQVFKTYVASALRPASDAQKRDMWLVQFSGHVGRNLGPFFEHWGVPVSAEAKRAVAQWPVWMHSNASPASMTPPSSTPSSSSAAPSPSPPVPSRNSTPVDVSPSPPPPPAHHDDEDDSKLCIVCLEAPKSVALIPCGHLCLCDKCSSAKGLKKCPVCRTDVASVLRVFQ